MRHADLRRSARRLAFARLLLLAVFAALGLRAAQLSLFDPRGAVRGDAQSLRVLTLPSERGAIFDRAGAELALSVDAPSIYANPSAVTKPAEAAGALAEVLGIDRKQLEKQLRRRGFQFLARWVDDKRAERVRALGLPGIGILEEPRRIYPHRGLAAPVVGFTNIDGAGVRGIEQQEDSWLRGTTRRIPVERDGGGDLLLAAHAADLGTAGGEVTLTLDAALQADAERALREAVEASGARGGLVLSMDPHSGAVYALATAPSFDPNRFRELDYASTRAVAFLDAVEPGSALKVFTLAAALESGSLTAEQRIDCEQGSYRIPGKTIRDLHPHGELDAAGILRVSSNIGTVKIAHELGRRAHFQMLRSFGFGASTDSGFPDESAGVLRPWRRWRDVDHATIAFGQGISVTPIQLAAAVAAIANGGELVRPRIVAGRRRADGAWQPTRPEVVRRVVSRDTAKQLLSMLESVVGPEGTGSRAALPGIRVAGKTGTAQKFDANTGRYATDRFRAWFVGMLPVDDPKLVIVVQLDEPKRPQHTGGAVAAPLFARVATGHLAQLGIEPDPGAAPELQIAAEPPAPAVATTPAVASPPAEPPAPTPPPIAAFGGRVLLPDFSGLTPEQVTRVTEEVGLVVELLGRGRAVRQDPPPGTVLAADGRVQIEFAPSSGVASRSSAVPPLMRSENRG